MFSKSQDTFFNVNTTLELLFYLENIGLIKEEMDVRMEEMLQIFHIEHLLGRNIFESSGVKSKFYVSLLVTYQGVK